MGWKTDRKAACNGRIGDVMTYHVRLSHFEGPMDLLLHLIRRDKINIYDIPISHITREYLSYIEIMQELQLEVAGEFFVTAATLMRIKSQLLLPRRVNDEDEEDPREELVRNLLEYKKFKEAAHHLSEKEDVRRKMFTRPMIKIPGDVSGSRTMEVTLFDLVGAFRKVMEDLKKHITYRIERETVTLEEKIALIRTKLVSKSEILFTELFDSVTSRIDIIVTFLALLEMVKRGETIAKQMSSGSDIWLYTPETLPSTTKRDMNNGTRERQNR